MWTSGKAAAPISYWNMVKEVILGTRQLNIDLNTKYNVTESLHLPIKVHKSGRINHVM
jgi:hypothetical protein